MIDPSGAGQRGVMPATACTPAMEGVAITDAARQRRRQLDERICRLICPIASAMVGVCLTGIGLLHVSIAIGRRAGIADDLLAVDALLFLVATLASYFSLRSLDHRRLHAMERVADATFITAMLLLTAACFVITYALGL